MIMFSNSCLDLVKYVFGTSIWFLWVINQYMRTYVFVNMCFGKFNWWKLFNFLFIILIKKPLFQPNKNIGRLLLNHFFIPLLSVMVHFCMEYYPFSFFLGFWIFCSVHLEVKMMLLFKRNVNVILIGIVIYMWSNMRLHVLSL
jgi:hypothetical protein